MAERAMRSTPGCGPRFNHLLRKFDASGLVDDLHGFRRSQERRPRFRCRSGLCAAAGSGELPDARAPAGARGLQHLVVPTLATASIMFVVLAGVPVGRALARR